MANTTISTMFATTAVLALAACGGGSSSVNNNPTVFGTLPNQELKVLLSNQDGSGIASSYRRNNSYLLYDSDVSQYAENGQEILDSQVNIDINALSILEETVDYIFLEGPYVSSGNSKYIFVYSKIIGSNENILVALSRNQNTLGGEMVQAFGDIVSGTVPIGDVVYSGYNLFSSTDQTVTDSGSFTMRVNFQNGSGSLDASGDTTFVTANAIAVNATNGTFSSASVRLGIIDGASTSGFLKGNFHGSEAKGVTGIYGNTGDMTQVGVIAGSR